MSYSGLASEFEAQGELHDARISEQARIVAEAAAAAESECRREQTGLNVEANGVGYVESLPAELKALRLTPGHGPTLRDSEVESEEAVAADDIALSRLSSISRSERTDGSRTIGENIGSAGVEEGSVSYTHLTLPTICSV